MQFRSSSLCLCKYCWHAFHWFVAFHPLTFMSWDLAFHSSLFMKGIFCSLPLLCMYYVANKDPFFSSFQITLVLWSVQLFQKWFLPSASSHCSPCPFWSLQKVLDSLAFPTLSLEAPTKGNLGKAVFFIALTSDTQVSQLYPHLFLDLDNHRPRWISGVFSSFYVLSEE